MPYPSTLITLIDLPITEARMVRTASPLLPSTVAGHDWLDCREAVVQLEALPSTQRPLPIFALLTSVLTRRLNNYRDPSLLRSFFR
jgi:hypothetical protein